MKKNIVVVSLISVLLLSGCGAGGEQLWKQAANPDITFVDTKEQADELLKKAEKNTGTENGMFAEEVVAELQKLEEALKEPLEKGLLKEVEYEAEDYEEYEEGEDIWDGMTISEVNEKIRSGKLKKVSSNLTICSDYESKNTNAFKEALSLLEKKGYDGLTATDMTQTIRGISFSIYHDNGKWTLEASISIFQLYWEKEIGEFVKNTVDSCFYVENYISGGYIQRLQISGIQGDSEENFSQTMVVDIRDKKAICMTMKIQCNKKQVSGKVFTEQQQPTIIRMLSQMTGDEKASTEFVKNLELKTDKKGKPVVGIKSGEIGNKKYLIQGESYYYDDEYANFILKVTE